MQCAVAYLSVKNWLKANLPLWTTTFFYDLLRMGGEHLLSEFLDIALLAGLLRMLDLLLVMDELVLDLAASYCHLLFVICDLLSYQPMQVNCDRCKSRC